jgi:hypothetical protein
VQVDSVTLDTIVAERGCPPPRLLKIDVEGFEFDVLKGAARMLASEQAPVVLFESNLALLPPPQGGFADIQRWFAVRGYVLYGLTPRGLKPVHDNASRALSHNTLAARPEAHAAVLERLAHRRFRRNQSS